MIEGGKTNFRAFAGYFLDGVVWTAVYAILTDGMRLPLGLVSSLLGGLVLGIAEASGWAVESRWTKGVVFGGVAGGLAGASSFLLFSEEPLMQELASHGVRGLVGGMIWKGLTVSPVEETAA